MRDHSPITIKEFNGLYDRGDKDSVPFDHFSNCNNIAFTDTGFKTRDGIDIYAAYPNVSKMYTYAKVSSESVLVLDASGNIYDTGSPTPFTPILTISTMVDFGFAVFAGRAYISPNTTISGMPSEYLYVYAGDGTPARLAAGNPPTDAEGALAAANSGGTGNVEAGIHIFGVVYETISGYLTAIGPDTLATVTAPSGDSVDLTNIPVSASSFVTKVHIVASRAIDPNLYIGNTRNYQLFFVPGAIVNNGVTTLTVSFFDSELLEDASHLFDNYSQIPAGVGLTTYHGRLILYTLFPVESRSTILVSNPGEPEAFNQIDGIILLEADNTPITNAQELRDVLYIFKNVRTYAVNDNGDVPSSWPLTILDQGMGSTLHGIATVLDTGGVGIDYLIITNYTGIYLFNGSYIKPELSWKIQTYWINFGKLDVNNFPIVPGNFSEFLRTQIYNNSIDQILYIILSDLEQMLIGDYRRGLDSKNIKWGVWSFGVEISCITLVNFNTLLIGSKRKI